MLTHGIFGVYKLLSTTIPVIALLIFSLLRLLVTTYYQQESQNRRNTAEICFHKIVSWFFGDWIQFSDFNKKYYLRIDGVHTTQCPTLPHGVLIFLFTYVLIQVTVAIVIFFELFVFTISSTCGSDNWVFCFPTGINSAERIQNCTMQESEVTCYWPFFDPVTPASVISTLYGVIRFGIFSVNNRIIEYCWRKKWVVALYVIVLLFVVIGLVFICAMGAVSRRKMGNTFLRELVFILPCFSLIILSIFCVYLVLTIFVPKINCTSYFFNGPVF